MGYEKGIEQLNGAQASEPLNPRYASNPILERSLQFSLQLIQYCEQLELEKKIVIARQLLKSGTSIGANCREAQNAESTKHFVSKFKIALRELDETEYWLEVCEKAPSYPTPPVELTQGLDQMSRIINKIIATTSKNMKQ